MSTLKAINVVHPSSATNNIVNDASGNVTIGNNLSVTGAATFTGAVNVPSVTASGNLSVAGTSTLTGNVTAAGTVAMGSSFKRNRIINGNMLIDQRNAGASVTANDGVFPVDRFKFSMTQSSKGTGQQSTTAPTGFISSLLFTSSAATSVGASDQFAIVQNIEGLNVADLGWGSASALSVTLSFWVRSSLTGTFGGALQNSAANRSYPFSYTISAANTWEQKSVTIAGDTSGTWLTTNGIGLRVFLSLGMGSTYSGTSGAWAATNYQSTTGAVSVVGTSGATFYVTGTQLEVGTKATPYEMQIYSDQLAQCQRYLPVLQPNAGGTTYIPSAIASSVSAFQAYYVFKVTPRVPPTGITTTTASGFSYNDSATATAATGFSFLAANYDACLIGGTVSGGLTQFRPGALQLSSTSQIQFTGCEL